jgi:integrase
MAIYKQCGCVDKNACDHPWWGQFHGVRVSLEKWAGEIVRTPGKARRIFLRLQRWVLAGKPPRDPQRAPEPPLASLLEDYVQLHMIAKGRSYHGSEEYRIAAIRRQFGALRASEIGTLEVERWVFALRKQGCGAATVRRYVARLRAILNWAVIRGRLEAVRVIWKALDLPPESRGRTRRFLSEEEQRVKEASPSRLRDIIELALDTGLRQATLLGLTFEMVDFDEGRIRVPRALLKNKHSAEDLVIPMTTRVRAIVERRMVRADGRTLPLKAFILGRENGSSCGFPKKAWNEALRLAGVSRATRGWTLRFHDIRREFASRLLESGASIPEIRELLDHSNVLMTDRYMRSHVQQREGTMKRFEMHNESLAVKLREEAHNGRAQANNLLEGVVQRKETGEAGVLQSGGHRVSSGHRDLHGEGVGEEGEDSPRADGAHDSYQARLG